MNPVTIELDDIVFIKALQILGTVIAIDFGANIENDIYIVRCNYSYAIYNILIGDLYKVERG